MLDDKTKSTLAIICQNYFHDRKNVVIVVFLHINFPVLMKAVQCSLMTNPYGQLKQGHLWVVIGTADTYKNELHLKLSKLEQVRQMILNFHIISKLQQMILNFHVISKLQHAYSWSKQLQLLQR